MALTLPELKARLSDEFTVDELADLLRVTGDELLDAFEDKIAEDYERLQKAVDFPAYEPEEWRV
jgi:hypothetical protein